MDTSKEYILMCRKVKEIQQIFKTRGLGENDFINRDMPDSNRSGFVLMIWLPRQDQLQEMILGEYKEKFKNSLAFISKGEGYLSEEIMKDILTWSNADRKIWQGGKKKWWKSMEQLWLAFVMHKIFNKTWNNHSWVD